MKKIGLIILLFIVSSVLVYFFSSDTDYVKQGKLYINEIVASNNYSHASKDGEYHDYIEIYNGYSYEVNLEGYHLADSLADIDKWKFPDITIDANEYLIIYASKKNICNSKDDCHTNFKLSSEGESVLLTDNNGNIISKIHYPKLSNDTSFSLVGKKYVVTLPTPGKENTEKEIKNINIKKSSLLINEYITHNKSSNYASDGGYYDWIEIYNASDNDIDLENISISDDANNLNKFRLPNETIKKGEYKVIYLTDGVNIPNEICANFKLSDTDQKIILSNNGNIIDSVDIVLLDQNVSYGKKDDKWLYFYTPTPGKENTTHGVERVSE